MSRETVKLDKVVTLSIDHELIFDCESGEKAGKVADEQDEAILETADIAQQVDQSVR